MSRTTETPDIVRESRGPIEARSGLDPWNRGELPSAPAPHGIGWVSAVGPGVIALGASIGSGEFLLGPAAFVRYGLSLLWIVGVAALLQTLFNLELMRYTLATGEPAFTGFMRTPPRSTLWAWFYSLLYFLQMGWPGWAGAAAGALFFLVTRRLPAAADANLVYGIGVVLFLLCGSILSIGRRIERTLEYLNWVLVIFILGGMGVLAVLFVPPRTWLDALTGFVGYDTNSGTMRLLPAGADFFLLGAVAAYSGAGGVINITLSNWARDKGYGMGSVVGYIPAAVGGRKVALAHTGSTFEPSGVALERWRGWWRIVRVDQWCIYFLGALLGMMLPALLYVTFLPAGTDIRGLGIAAALAHAVASREGAIFGGAIAVLGVWLLFKTQLDILEGMTRAITDILWTGSKRVRAARSDVRVVYYGVLAVVVLWGIVALRLTQPIVLLALSANMGGIVFIISALHLLYVNTTLLPPELRPPLSRRIALVALALFYGAFLALWLGSLL